MRGENRMLDIRTGKEEMKQAVRFADDDCEACILRTVPDDHGGAVVAVCNIDGDIVCHIETPEDATNLINALYHAQRSGFWMHLEDQDDD